MSPAAAESLGERVCERASDLGRRVGALALAEAVGSLCSLATHILVARSLGAVDYGRFLALATAGIWFVGLSSAGIPQVLRRMAGAGGWIPRTRLHRLAGIHGGVFLPILAIVALLAPSFAARVGDVGLAWPIRALCLELGFQCVIFEPCFFFLNGTGQIVRQALLLVAFHAIRLSAAGTASALFGRLLAVSVGLALASTFASAAALAMSRSRAQIVEWSGRATLARPLGWAVLSACYECFAFLPIGGHAWLVRSFVPGDSGLGMYSACLAAGLPFLALGRALLGGAFAPLAAAFTAGESRRAGSVLRRAVTISAPIFGSGTLLIAWYGCAFLEWACGPEFVVPPRWLAAILLGSCGFAFAAFFGGVLGVADRSWLRLGLAAVVAMASILLTTALTRTYGLRGGSLAFMASGAFAAGVMGLAACRAVALTRPTFLGPPNAGVIEGI